MKIIINNNDDLEKFYKKIKYYRSILFIFTKFESNNKDIEKIIYALNIKNRFKRIDYIYEEACNEIDNYNKNKNLCNFKNNICRNKVKYGCCRKCYNLGNKGCTTSNLTCKLFFCSKVCDKYKVLTFEDVKILKCLSFNNQVIIKHDFFTKKEELLMDLYVGSMTIFIFRYLYRVIIHRLIRKI